MFSLRQIECSNQRLVTAEPTLHLEQRGYDSNGLVFFGHSYVLSLAISQECKAMRDEDLLVLPTDAALFEDEGFRWGSMA